MADSTDHREARVTDGELVSRSGDKVVVRYKMTGPSGHLRVGSRNGSISPDADSCSWSPSEEVTAYYFGHILDHVTDVYDAPVECYSGIADFIFNSAVILFNETYDESSRVSDNCDQGPCTRTDPTSTYLCAETILCAGEYEMENNFTIVLYSQYYWTPPAPSGCVIRNEQTMSCDLFTGQVLVNGTDV